MGSGIATALILSNYPVILKEVNENFLKAGIERVKGSLAIFLLYLRIVPVLSLYALSLCNLLPESFY